MRSGIVSRIKQLVVAEGEAARTIKTGPFKGLTMNLNLTSQTQMYLGLFERETYVELKSLSAGIAMGIDIGAAYGEYTLFFLAKTQAIKVLAFEPSEDMRSGLRENLRLNSLERDPRLEISSKLVGNENSGDVCDLDSLAHVIRSPCLIKMDIDGGETTVLEGASKLLQFPQIRWLIETHSPELEQSCLSILNKAGYITKIIPNAWWRRFVPEQRPIEHNRWLIASKASDVRL